MQLEDVKLVVVCVYWILPSYPPPLATIAPPILTCMLAVMVIVIPRAHLHNMGQQFGEHVSLLISVLSVRSPIYLDYVRMGVHIQME
jgi:hypothetical protein